MILSCSRKYRYRNARMESPIPMEESSTYSAACFSCRSVQATEIRVKSMKESKTRQKRRLIFRVVRIFMGYLDSRLNCFSL